MNFFYGYNNSFYATINTYVDMFFLTKGKLYGYYADRGYVRTPTATLTEPKGRAYHTKPLGYSYFPAFGGV